MERFKKIFKKKILITMGFLSLPIFSVAYAQEGMSNALLAQIRDYTQQTAQFTNGILAKVNQLPEYIKKMMEMAESWLDTEDTSNAISVNGTLTNLLKESINQDKQGQLNFSLDATRSFFEKSTPANLNELSYSVLLGTPLAQVEKPDLQAWAKNYISTVSGSSINLERPDPSWKDRGENQRDYYNLYNALSAVQSYNSYVISRAMLERQKKMKAPPGGILGKPEGTPLSTDDILSMTVDQASSADWFAQIGSESLGLVLRQILVFNSQTYVLLKQMVDYQQQMVTAQAMSNMLLMQSNIGNARLLYQRATGKI